MCVNIVEQRYVHVPLTWLRRHSGDTCFYWYQFRCISHNIRYFHIINNFVFFRFRRSIWTNLSDATSVARSTAPRRILWYTRSSTKVNIPIIARYVVRDVALPPSWGVTWPATPGRCRTNVISVERSSATSNTSSTTSTDTSYRRAVSHQHVSMF